MKSQGFFIQVVWNIGKTPILSQGRRTVSQQTTGYIAVYSVAKIFYKRGQRMNKQTIRKLNRMNEEELLGFLRCFPDGVIEPSAYNKDGTFALEEDEQASKQIAAIIKQYFRRKNE